MIITVAQIEVFFLILARISGVFITAPLLKLRYVPSGVKMGIIFWMTTVLWFVVPLTYPLPVTMLELAIALTIELIIGALIGFVCDIIFTAITAAGDIMEQQMGLVRQTLDPLTGSPSGIMGQAAFIIGAFIFLSLDGHHLIFSALHQSFKVLPLGMPINVTSGKLAFEIIGLCENLWLTSIQLAAPIVLLIFLSDFAFGIVSRVAPQVNVFMLGFQVKPSLGLLAFIFCLPLFARHIVNLISSMLPEMITLFSNLKM